jgi:hypothetical protein
MRYPGVVLRTILIVFVLRNTVWAKEVEFNVVESLPVRAISSYNSVQSTVVLKYFLVRTDISADTDVRTVQILTGNKGDCKCEN